MAKKLKLIVTVNENNEATDVEIEVDGELVKVLDADALAFSAATLFSSVLTGADLDEDEEVINGHFISTVGEDDDLGGEVWDNVPVVAPNGWDEEDGEEL